MFDAGALAVPESASTQNEKIELARKLEVALYKASKSKEEYMKTHDLPVRVGELIRGEAVAPDATKPSHVDVLKQRQERLLLLRHASKCTVPDGKCGTRHCGPMQKLWKHLSDCKQADCKVAHCVSSRYVLSHYHRCQDKSCEVCAPVREKTKAARAAEVAEQQQQHQAASMAPPPVPSSLAGNGTSNGVGEPAAELHSTVSDREKIDPRFARGAKDGAGPSLPESMDRADLGLHVVSLTVEQLQEALFPTLRRLMEHKANNNIFNSPVDPVAQGVPDYLSVIKKPMDLGTVRRKLEEGSYHHMKDFEADVRLTFDNAMRFNPAGHPVYDIAQLLLKEVDKDMSKVRERMNSARALRGRDEKNCQLCGQENCERCSLCGRGCLSFEPKVIYCCGPCRGRVERGKLYFQPSGSSLVWCQDCFDAAARQGQQLVDASTGQRYSRDELNKRKNDECIGEPWVECQVCKRWTHQICTLFNTRKNTHESRYTCPCCLLSNKSCVLPRAPRVPGCEDLEQTHLGAFLETWVRAKLDEAFAQDRRQRQLHLLSNPPPSSSVHIRILSNYEETLKVKPFGQRLLGMPDTLPYRSRAIFLFQKLDGVDVLLFVMYVQECDSKAPPPNRGKLYIAYLDSVHFFRPRYHRTLVYHELLLAYLEYSRRNGYTSCYIWACPPPTKRDDYVIHCHPTSQRVPSPDRLRKWYHDMIRRGTADGVVLSSCSMYEEHFEDGAKPKPKNKSHKKQLPSSQSSQGPSSSSSSLSQSHGKQVGRGVKRPTTPAAVEDTGDDLLASLSEATDGVNLVAPTPGPMQTPLVPSTSPAAPDTCLALGCVPGDPEMTPGDWERRRQTLLAARRSMPYFDGDYWPSEVEDMAADMARKNPANKGRRDETDQELLARNGHEFVNADDMIKRLGGTLEAMKDDFIVVKLAHQCSRCGVYVCGRRWECRHAECVAASGFARPSPFALCEACFELEMARPASQQHGNGCVVKSRDVFASSAAPEREFALGSTRLRLPTYGSHTLLLVDEGLAFEHTPAWDKDQRNALIETRHAFLSLCTGNRYAFNELRRAKHTTMMILYHLHNPDAPAHLFVCNDCQNDILVGFRYHCSECNHGDFDLCVTCFRKGRHPHRMVAIEVTKGVDTGEVESQREQQMAEKRRSRQHSLKVFLRALVHASSCKEGEACEEPACRKMTQLLQHRTLCQVRVRGGCEVCRRVLCLVQMHAKECTAPGSCPVPHCEDLKKHIKQQQLEEQQSQETPGSLKIKLKVNAPQAKRPKTDA